MLSLVPAEAKTDNEWRYHHVRVGVHLETDNGPQTMTLWIAQQAVMTREISAVPERIDLVLRPDDAVVVMRTNLAAVGANTRLAYMLSPLPSFTVFHALPSVETSSL